MSGCFIAPLFLKGSPDRFPRGVRGSGSAPGISPERSEGENAAVRNAVFATLSTARLEIILKL